MNITTDYAMPITMSKMPQLDRAALLNQAPLNADKDGRYDIFELKADDEVNSQYSNYKPTQITITPIDPSKTAKTPFFDIGALGLNSEETKLATDFVLDIQRGIYSNGTQSYSDFAYLGIATAKANLFAINNLAPESAKSFTAAFSKAIDGIKNNPYSDYNVVDNSRYFSDGKGSNRELKDAIFNTFANLDTSSVENFNSSFDTAQKQYSQLLKPLLTSQGYASSPTTLQRGIQYSLNNTADVFSGSYRKTATLEEIINHPNVVVVGR